MKLSTGVDVAVTIKEVAKQEHRNLFSIPKAKTIKMIKLEMQVVDVLRNNVIVLQNHNSKDWTLFLR